MKMELQPNTDEKSLYDALNFFFSNFVLKAGVATMFTRKVKGASVMVILRKLCELVFMHMTFNMAVLQNPESIGFSRSALSRFLTSPRNNWLRFTTRIAQRVCAYISTLTQNSDNGYMNPQKSLIKHDGAWIYHNMSIISRHMFHKSSSIKL